MKINNKIIIIIIINNSGEDTITQSRRSKKQKTQTKDSESLLFLSIRKSLKDRNEMTESMDDHDRIFLLSLINDFKQVSMDKKMEVKLRIMQNNNLDNRIPLF